MDNTLASFTDVLDDELCDSQPISLPSSADSAIKCPDANTITTEDNRYSPRIRLRTGQKGCLRSSEEIDPKYRDVFMYKHFNLVQSKVIDDALYSDKSVVVCAPTGSGKTVVFEMAIVQLLMELEAKNYTEDFKIIYMAPVKALCTERLTEWYPKFMKFGLLCIEATGDTDVDFSQLQPYKIIITTPEKWDMLTRRWRDHRSLVEVIKLFLIDEVHILNDETRGPVLEAVVSRMKTIESSAQSVHRIEKLQNQLTGSAMTHKTSPSIRFLAVSATVSNPEDVAEWLGTSNKPAVFHKFGDECRPVKLNRIVEGYPCPVGTSIFKFDIILNYKLWPIIQKYHRGKPTLIFCNTRKSVTLTAETLSRELTINFNAEQKAKLTALASTIKNKKLQSLVMNGVGCHHAGLLYEERQMIERAFRNRDLPILITTTTLAMGVNLPAHLVIIKNTQQYVNGTFQEYSISTVLQMVGRAGRPQFDTEATAVIVTRLADKGRYQALIGGCEPLQSYLHKRLPENLNSEAALGTVGDVAQCVQWLRSTFLYVRAARDPKRYLGLPQKSPQHLISKKIEELCVKAMNGLASSGLITMDEASCIECTEAGRLMSIFYLDVETMKLLMRIEGTETLERLLTIVCESHELSDMHLRTDERRCLNALNRNNAAATIRFPMKGKISTRQMKLNCVIQAVLGCLTIPDPSLNQEAMKIMRIADRVCKCLVAYVTRPDLISNQPIFYSAVLNSIILAKCITAHLWENSPFVSKQLKGIGPTFSTLLATAGKVNFMLLEESHPRDLERIMNKCAPAGNVLRRQISLLPKYQLSITPINESSVMVQLQLLNQSFLAENIDDLTAGGGHKCYIVVGDSTNHLLLLASFKDMDLLGVFDGTMNYEIKRRHNYEHKIFAHCVSSTFVGVDVQSEYVYEDLNKLYGSPNINYNKNDILINGTVSHETGTLGNRKRKNSSDTDKTQSKEKKKRENALIKNFIYLKKTFETHSNNVRENKNLPFKKHEVLSNETIATRTMVHKDEERDETNRTSHDINGIEDIDSDNFIDNDEKMNDILTEIENEICKRKRNVKTTNSLCPTDVKEIDINRDLPISKYQTTNKTLYQPKNKLQKPLPVKSNYSFIDLLEKKLDLNDDDEKTMPSNNGFSDTIKSHINKYIKKAETITKREDPHVQLLISENRPKSDLSLDPNSKEFMPTQKSPRYEIKEILDGITIPKETETNSKEIQCKSINPKELAVTVITSTNDDDDVATSIPSDALEETKFSHSQITEDNSKTLCVSKDHSQKSSEREGECNSNSQNIYLHCKDFQTHVTTSLLKKDMIKTGNIGNVDIEMTENKSFSIKQHCSKTIDTHPNKTLSEIRDKNIHILPICNDNPKEIYESNAIDSGSRKTLQANNQCLDELLNKYYHKDCKNQNTCSVMDGDRKRDIILKECNLTPSGTSQLLNVAISANHSPPIISEPVSLYTNNYRQPLLTNSGYCTNNSTSNGNKNEYVRKYSFSSTQVDIKTKQMSEYSIQVIKEIKMDLNVTEIIRADQSPQTDSMKPENINKLETNGLTKPISNNIDNYCINKQTAIKSTEPAINRHSEKDEEINTAISELFPFSNKDTQIGKNIIYNKNYTKNEEVKCSVKNIVPITNVTNMKEIINEKSEDFIDFNHSPRPTIEGSVGNENENKLKTQTSTAQNILQKYSKILGNETTENQPPIYSATNKKHIYKKSPAKSKKPFTIRNIKEFQVTIPETITHCYKQEDDIHAPTASILVHNESSLKKSSTETECYTPLVNMDSINECCSYQSITDVNLEPLYIPADIHLEHDIDYNVDQSMFDPKTLLQCTVDDKEANNEEIITPPPQFCDFNTESQHSLDAVELNQAHNSILSGESLIGLCTDNAFDCNESIFERYGNTNLTPSREIETWTLDEQDVMEQRNIPLSLSPPKSFTVIRRNNSNSRNPLHMKVMEKSNQPKLATFKFTHKKKLQWK